LGFASSSASSAFDAFVGFSSSGKKGSSSSSSSMIPRASERTSSDILLTSRAKLPTLRAISGSFSGPNTMRATTAITRISIGPISGMGSV
jgi:hypothetical protein